MEGSGERGKEGEGKGEGGRGREKHGSYINFIISKRTSAYWRTQWTNLKDRGEFPGGPVVRTRRFHCQVRVQSLVRKQSAEWNEKQNDLLPLPFRWVKVFAHKTIYILQEHIQIKNSGTSLVEQWLRICLPVQGTQVWALVWEDPTCLGATKPVCHNCWTHVPQLLKPTCLEPVLRNKRSHRNEKPAHRNQE